MAIHGLSTAENTRFILRSDPAHPDSIKAAFEKRMNGRDDVSQDERDEILAQVERAAGQPTVFLLGNLLHEDRVFLGDLSGGMEQTPTGGFRMTPKNNAKASETVRRALRGWENFTDMKGIPITFKSAPGTGERGQPRSFVSPESMSAIPLEVIKELSMEILELNGVTGALEKKLLGALQAGYGLPSEDGPAQAAPMTTNFNEDAEAQA